MTVNKQLCKTIRIPKSHHTFRRRWCRRLRVCCLKSKHNLHLSLRCFFFLLVVLVVLVVFLLLILYLLFIRRLILILVSIFVGIGLISNNNTLLHYRL